MRPRRGHDTKQQMSAPLGIEQDRGPSAPAVASRLLRWYDRHRRSLPWRADPDARPDPYRIWLSEVMLQQTTVAAVTPYYQAFLARWPTVRDLAAAELDEVLHAWQGLGYYARARNLHKCAIAVAGEMGGKFPAEEAALRTLPGIGAYTAAAIAAIAYDQPAVVVDGNVERVMARIHDVASALPAAKPELRALAAQLTPVERPGDYAQAVMDLGATICVPRTPRCSLCPVADLCQAKAAGTAAARPVRAAKAERPVRYGVAFWISRPDGAVLLRRRPEKGLLGGMMEIPSSDWREQRVASRRALAQAPVLLDRVGPRTLPGLVRHTFTHFHLELTVVSARLPRAEDQSGVWVPIDRLSDYALPSLMKKIVRHVAAHEGPQTSR